MSVPKNAVALLVLAAACAPRVEPTPAPATPAPVTAPQPVDQGALTRDLQEFASDAFRGRETGTPGEMMSARFIAARARAIGLEPAGDSGFLQRVPLVSERITEATSFTVTRGGQTVAIPLGGGLAPLISLGDNVFARQNAEGDVVFAGFGVPDPATGRDELAQLTVRNRVVVVLMAAPPGVDTATRRQLEGQDGISIRLQRLIPLGPAAVVLLFTGPGGERLYEQVTPVLMRSMTLASRAGQEPPPDAQRPVPMILLGRAEAATALLPAQYPRDVRPQTLPARFSGHAVTSRTPVTGYNVVARLRGSDPRLGGSYVALGAHHDHVGVQAPVNGDSIANGADDDGSGSMAMLAVARSLAAAPHPRRSVLFVWHTGEEKGLLGSEWFTTHPTVPIDSIVAMVNADMIGRDAGSTEDFNPATDTAGANRLYIVGPAAAPEGRSRVLGAIVDSVNARLGRPFALDREWDDPNHPERIYFRSDHYNYAQHGVPVIFLTTGLHGDYHKVSDEADRIDFPKLARVATLLRDVVTAIADRPTRPR